MTVTGIPRGGRPRDSPVTNFEIPLISEREYGVVMHKPGDAFDAASGILLARAFVGRFD